MPTLNRSAIAVFIVVICAAMWGFWWLPVSLVEDAGLGGAHVGAVMNAAVIPIAAMWALMRPGGLSTRAIIGALIVGVAVSLYAISVVYTDFLRAVLLFYLAPAWSTLIECLFFGRRWSLRSLVAILVTIAGVILISRGEISFDGLGAVGDWMALISGLSWSVGTALIFSSRRAEVSRVLMVSALGGIVISLTIAELMGQGLPGLDQVVTALGNAPEVFVFAALYIGILLAGTMWGAFILPPAVMSYLLSIEIIAGILSSTLILGERFGWLEFGGAVCITGAVLIEVIWTPRITKRTAT